MFEVKENAFFVLMNHFETATKLAEALDVSSVAVHYWMKEKNLPPKRAAQIEVITKGAIKARDLINLPE